MDIYEVRNMMRMTGKTILDLHLRVTFYGRVSTLREEQENSLDSQIKFFTDFIKGNKNWTYVEGYVDKKRGESAEARVNFMRMIEDANNDKFDLIITKEVARFARDTIDSLQYTRDLLKIGVGVFFQNDNLCTIDSDSEFRTTIMSGLAQDEVRKLSERVRWGHKVSIEKGRVAGNSRIFGYDKDRCKLVINEEEAEMVRTIFEMYSTGRYSVRKIEDVLFEKGYLGRNGTRIHHNTISGIIQNPKYKGYYCGNKVKVVDYRTKAQKFLPKEEWVMYKDETGEIVPAIVSEELWDRCNEIFEERSAAVKSKEKSFKDKSLLTGKIYCGVHNKPFWRTSYSHIMHENEPIYQWMCSEKRRFGAKQCATTYIREDELYDSLGKAFKNLSHDFNEYMTTLKEILSGLSEENIGSSQINALNQRIKRAEKKKEKLLELYMDECITRSEFVSRNENIGKEIDEIKAELDAVAKKSNYGKSFDDTIRNIELYLSRMYDKDSDMSKEQIDILMDTLVQKIVVYPVDEISQRVEVVFKTKDKYEFNSRRSGHIFKKMIPEQQYSYKHINRTAIGHEIDVKYIVIFSIF